MTYLLKFKVKNGFLDLFARFKIKTNFSFKCPVLILFKSIFKLVAEVMIKRTTKKREKNFLQRVQYLLTDYQKGHLYE